LGLVGSSDRQLECRALIFFTSDIELTLAGYESYFSILGEGRALSGEVSRLSQSATMGVRGVWQNHLSLLQNH